MSNDREQAVIAEMRRLDRQDFGYNGYVVIRTGVTGDRGAVPPDDLLRRLAEVIIDIRTWTEKRA